jgi:hypothetical protein
VTRPTFSFSVLDTDEKKTEENNSDSVLPAASSKQGSSSSVGNNHQRLDSTSSPSSYRVREKSAVNSAVKLGISTSGDNAVVVGLPTVNNGHLRLRRSKTNFAEHLSEEDSSDYDEEDEDEDGDVDDEENEEESGVNGVGGYNSSGDSRGSGVRILNSPPRPQPQATTTSVVADADNDDDHEENDKREGQRAPRDGSVVSEQKPKLAAIAQASSEFYKIAQLSPYTKQAFARGFESRDRERPPISPRPSFHNSIEEEEEEEEEEGEEETEERVGRKLNEKEEGEQREKNFDKEKVSINRNKKNSLDSSAPLRRNSSEGESSRLEAPGVLRADGGAFSSSLAGSQQAPSLYRRLEARRGSSVTFCLPACASPDSEEEEDNSEEYTSTDDSSSLQVNKKTLSV